MSTGPRTDQVVLLFFLLLPLATPTMFARSNIDLLDLLTTSPDPGSEYSHPPLKTLVIKGSPRRLPLSLHRPLSRKVPPRLFPPYTRIHNDVVVTVNLDPFRIADKAIVHHFISLFSAVDSYIRESEINRLRNRFL